MTEQFIQTANTFENRIIKTALERALGALRSDVEAGRNLLAVASRCFNRMPAEIKSLSEFERRVLDSRPGTPSGSHRRYERALHLAFMLLAGEGISLDDVGADRILGSYILNLENVYEDYLRRALQACAAGHLLVMNGNGEARRPLYSGRLGGPFAQPDMVVRLLEGGRSLIAEVKYKTKVDRTDVNQAVTYAVAYETNETVLIYVAEPGGQSGGYFIGTVGDVRVSAFAFEMNAPSLEKQEQALASFLSALLDGRDRNALAAVA